jgi:hypothetical protein
MTMTIVFLCITAFLTGFSVGIVVCEMMDAHARKKAEKKTLEQKIDEIYRKVNK